MSLFLRRIAASISSCAKILRCAVLLLLTILVVHSASAVVIRGRLTDALGKPLSGGQVRLIEGGKVVAMAYANPDGTYELRTSDSGRFTLLGSARGFLPGIGFDFYGGVTDEVQQDVVLSTNTVRQDVSVTATGIPTPLPQLTAPVSILPGEDLSTRVGVVNELGQSSGAFVVQTGQDGGVTSLFLRGGNSDANLVLIDGVPSGDVGGTFDFGTVSSTAIGRIEIDRGPNSAMFGTDAVAGVVSIETPRGLSHTPLFTYSGDAGNLHTWRNEVSLGGAVNKFDYYAAFSRFDTSNALERDRYHSATSASNVGYSFNGNTQARVTIRNGVSGSGLPGQYDFQGVALDGRQSDQDLYAAGTIENRLRSSWHNMATYSLTRKREQSIPGINIGIPDGFGDFFGNLVTVRGANGFKATGQDSLFNFSYDQASNRDQLYYQSDYSPSVHFNALFGFRYDKERGSFNDALFGEFEKVQRTNFEYNSQFQGQYFDRLFYSLGGAIEKNHLYGIAGTPRFGLTYVPVRSSSKWFHGTRLRGNLATGVQEPTLRLEFASLYLKLLQAGDTTDIANFHIPKPGAERSRTYDFGVDQSIAGDRLVLKLGYFHNIYDHQMEGISGQALVTFFGLGGIPSVHDPFFEADLNSLAFRSEGAEGELALQATRRLFLRANYTYMLSRVLQSFSDDALAAKAGAPTENPELPGIAIGAESPLVGGRPFRRPPNSGSFVVKYRRPKFDIALQGTFASRSDDSTFLFESDSNGGNTLLLPNRDLDFGYVKLDLGCTYQLKHGAMYFAQFDNLLNDQHIGPIGYPGLPLTFRTGLKLRLGGE